VPEQERRPSGRVGPVTLYQELNPAPDRTDFGRLRKAVLRRRAWEAVDRWDHLTATFTVDTHIYKNGTAATVAASPLPG
jgi:hypothetical protein